MVGLKSTGKRFEMFETQGPVEKSSRLTMLLVVFAVMVVLGGITWFLTQ
jgi:hypothetical protein